MKFTSFLKLSIAGCVLVRGKEGLSQNLCSIPMICMCILEIISVRFSKTAILYNDSSFLRELIILCNLTLVHHCSVLEEVIILCNLKQPIAFFHLELFFLATSFLQSENTKQIHVYLLSVRHNSACLVLLSPLFSNFFWGGEGRHYLCTSSI